MVHAAMRSAAGEKDELSGGSAVGLPQSRQLRVRFFAAGHGLSVLFQTPSGHAVLVDAGRGRQELLGDNLVRRRIVPHLRSRGIRRLDAWFITHPHFDHYGDPEALGRAVRIDRVLLNPDGEFWLGPKLARELGSVKREVVQRGHKLSFGRLRLKVLGPSPNGISPQHVLRVTRHNNRSLVILATFGKIRFLLTGDLLLRGERRLIRTLKVSRSTEDLRADVLQLGHHGNGSGQPAFLRRVRPRFAVASCGDTWQGWDRVPSSLLHSLARRKIRLLRTDRDGDVLFLTDGVGLDVDTQPEHIHVPRRVRSRRKRLALQRARARFLSSPRGRLTDRLSVPERSNR
ncbi:MAG: MBL fold metallo-hydrolase [bacterium]